MKKQFLVPLVDIHILLFYMKSSGSYLAKYMNTCHMNLISSKMNTAPNITKILHYSSISVS